MVGYLVDNVLKLQPLNSHSTLTLTSTTLDNIDYYKILEIQPSASLHDIKSAYRRLAHVYHPDKNNNDPYAAARFEIIKQAYEVLTSPVKKYHYLQRRWYDQVMNKRQTTDLITPVSVLKSFLELNKYVSRVDVHRLDQQGLYDYMSYLLKDETVTRLNRFGETDINNAIVESAIKTAHLLSFEFILLLAEKLRLLSRDEQTLASIHALLSSSKRSKLWNRYKVWVILLMVLMICCLIYLISS